MIDLISLPHQGAGGPEAQLVGQHPLLAEAQQYPDRPPGPLGWLLMMEGEGDGALKRSAIETLHSAASLRRDSPAE